VKEIKLKALERFPELKILVLGDVMLDVYDFCMSSKSRNSPERPGKRVYQAQKSLKTLGGAGNVAANLAALNVATVLISACGEDGQYLTLRELADSSKIHHFLVRDRCRQTTVKTRLYIDDEYILRRDDESNQPLNREAADTVMNDFLRELKGAEAVVLSDYDKGFFSQEMAQQIIEACNKRNIPSIVDFKPRNKTFFRGANVIAPNRHEADALLPGFNEDDELERKTKTLHALLECQKLVVTLGGSGLCCFDGKNFHHILANDVPVKDAVGCGDTVRAGLAVGLACGLKLHEAISLANDAAAIALQKMGTSVVPVEELRAFIAAR